MELSKRLRAVADMVTRGRIAADVGCDHGYVSIYLIKNQICPKVIAMDVNKGPLEKAKEHIKRYGLEAYIETRLSDGIVNMPEDTADTLICAGMGGKLIIKILEEGSEKTDFLKEIILQPQSEIHLVRQYIRKHGFAIMRENMILEDGKYYPVMKAERILIPAEHGGENQAELAVFDQYGEYLLKSQNSVLKDFLQKKKLMLQNLRQTLIEDEHKTAKRCIRVSEIEVQLQLTEAALLYFRS